MTSARERQAVTESQVIKAELTSALAVAGADIANKLEEARSQSNKESQLVLGENERHIRQL